MAERRVVLPGSERTAFEGAELLGPVDPSTQIHITVYVRGKEEPLPITEPGHYISQEEYAAIYGASANDFIEVRNFARSYNLEPRNENAAARSIDLYGSVADFSRAFGVRLDHARTAGTHFRHRVGGITIPENLLPIIRTVTGLDDRPQMKPHNRLVDIHSVRAAAVAQAMTPLAVGQLYNFPKGLDGTGATIAILEFGGGYRQTDLDQYFQGLGLKTPSVTAVSVDGATNAPIPPPPPNKPDPDGEVALDIEVAGALAPGAKQLIYFAPNTAKGFLDALNQAVTAKPAPSVISISWGAAESKWPAQTMQQFQSSLQQASQLGIPVCIASGDDGSFDGTTGLAVDFPSSCPDALGCGGTTLIGSGTSISSETVWSTPFIDPTTKKPAFQGTGGGVSVVFSKPSYQSSTSVPPPPGGGSSGGRGVPDVAGDADPATGYTMRLRGQNTVSGGTSAVAPLWSALIARFRQKLGKPVGFLHPLLYKSTTASAFHDITQGNNDTANKGGPYAAGKGWDACTGLGSPDGTALLNALVSSSGGGSGSTGAVHVTRATTTRPFVAPPVQEPAYAAAPPYVPGPVAPPEPVMPLPYPPVPPVPVPPIPAPLPPIPPPGPIFAGGNSVAIVGVVGLTAIVGCVAAAGVVATVALGKDK